MSKRWSKLQTRLYQIMDSDIDFQVHCALYEMNSNDGYHSCKLPRYFITVNKEIIFDYPKNFDTSQKYGFNSYPWDTDISDISDIIEEYIECPVKDIMEKFENDRWGITDIFRVCRVGKRRLYKLRDTIQDEIMLKIIYLRLNNIIKSD